MTSNVIDFRSWIECSRGGVCILFRVLNPLLGSRAFPAGGVKIHQ